MNTTTAQKEITRALAAAGMNAQGAAMHAAALGLLLQQNSEVRALLGEVQNSDDLEHRAHVVKSLMGRVSELIIENPELVKRALS